MANDQNTLKKLEINILKLLSDSTEEQILDEDDLIIVLEDSKKTSSEINVRIEQSKEVEHEINDTWNQYRSVAIRGSILYFVIADLAGIDPMYQYSLTYFIKLFNLIIETTEKFEDVHKWVDILLRQITETIYLNICRGLFNDHKLIFSFCIASKI